MALTVTQLRCKEVICLETGQRLGYVSDAVIRLPEGEVAALVVPGPCRFFGVAGRRDDYIIPWNCIRKIGPDIVLVDIKHDECRFPRHKFRLPF